MGIAKYVRKTWKKPKSMPMLTDVIGWPPGGGILFSSESRSRQG